MRVALAAAVTQFHHDAERTWRTRRLAELLADAGHDVVVCCGRWWTGGRRAVRHRGITYRAVTGHPADRGFGRRLATTLPRLRPDVVHAVHDDPRHVLGAAAGARIARAPLVVDWYDYGDAEGDGPRASLGERLTTAAASVPAGIVTPSRTVATRVRERGADGDRTRVIPNPIEFEAVRSAPVTDGGDVVYARRLDADANLESLLLALAELRTSDWTATVVGDGPAREAYERQASDLRIDDRVEFVGRLPIPERISLFKGAHAYVHTARRTPFPTDLCRALACGCVGVVEYHAESSAHELVEQQPRGLLATDDEELVDLIAAAAEMPHETVDESFAEYDGSAVVDRLLDCYAEARERVGLL